MSRPPHSWRKSERGWTVLWQRIELGIYWVAFRHINATLTLLTYLFTPIHFLLFSLR
jgi:uncharacterized membrane protein HdeD (DUF308 family)